MMSTDTITRSTDQNHHRHCLKIIEASDNSNSNDIFDIFVQYPALKIAKMSGVEKKKAQRTISSHSPRQEKPVQRRTLRRRSSLAAKLRSISPHVQAPPVIERPRSSSIKRELLGNTNSLTIQQDFISANPGHMRLTNVKSLNVTPDLSQEIVKQKLVRYRSFKMTKKGIVNLGDSLRSSSSINILDDVTRTTGPSPLKSRSPNVELAMNQRNKSLSPVDKGNFLKVNEINLPGAGCNIAKTSSDSKRESRQFPQNSFSIGVVGHTGVGKTTLCRQLLTSEHIGANINESFYEEDVPYHVNIELNGTIFNVHLRDEHFTKLISLKDEGLKSRLTSSYKRRTRPKLLPRRISTDGGTHGLLNDESDENIQGYEADEESFEETIQTNEKPINALMIVYAIDDVESYEYAKCLLKTLHENMGIWKLNGSEWSAMQIFLVGNKSDLVRSRVVDAERAKRLSMAFKCGFFEISTVMNHLVDDLLIAIIRKVNQTLARKSISTKILLQPMNQSNHNSNYYKLKIISDDPEDTKKRHKNSILQRGNNFLSIFKRYLPTISSEESDRRT